MIVRAPEDEVAVAKRTGWGVLGEAFHPGSLSTFNRLLSKGDPITAERIAAIKAKNSNWREHEVFRTYCEDFANGKIRRKRGRPPQPTIVVRNVVAMQEYPVYLKLLQRWKRQGRRPSMLTLHYPALDFNGLNNCHAAAEIVQKKFRLPFTAETLLVKMSVERNRF
jgi:hypothetical protein